ncbi:MAG TPA: tetratricopeptide repeat protein, partial [Planctomycetaceae bacterium]|nr:tetratricopeptide repeat protein [Planctomycetaceae bacterium]
IEDIDAYFATATCESPHELVALLILRGMAHLQLKEFGDAERSLQSALRHDPDNAAIFQNLWFAASQQDKYELAANWVEELQRVAPEQLGTVKMRAVTYMTLKRPEQAEPALQQWLKKAPRDAEALRYLCQLRHQSGQHAECLAALKRGLAAHPNDAVLLGMMTNVLATSPNTSIRNPQQANEYLERYREVETRRERVHYLQAIVLAANSDFDRAVAVLKESLAKDVLSLKERSQRESALSKLERNEKLLDDGSDSALNL